MVAILGASFSAHGLDSQGSVVSAGGESAPQDGILRFRGFTGSYKGELTPDQRMALCALEWTKAAPVDPIAEPNAIWRLWLEGEGRLDSTGAFAAVWTRPADLSLDVLRPLTEQIVYPRESTSVGGQTHRMKWLGVVGSQLEIRDAGDDTNGSLVGELDTIEKIFTFTLMPEDAIRDRTPAPAVRSERWQVMGSCSMEEISLELPESAATHRVFRLLRVWNAARDRVQRWIWTVYVPNAGVTGLLAIEAEESADTRISHIPDRPSNIRVALAGLGDAGSIYAVDHTKFENWDEPRVNYAADSTIERALRNLSRMVRQDVLALLVFAVTMLMLYWEHKKVR